MSKRLLFFMRHAGYVRNFESTLRELDRRGHSVHVVVDLTSKTNLVGLGDQLEALAAEHDGISWGTAPERRRSGWPGTAEQLHYLLDYARYLEPEFANAPKLRARAASRVPPAVTKLTSLRAGRSPRTLAAVEAAVKLALDGIPEREEVAGFIEAQAPDAVMITPLLELGSPQLEYLKAARALGIPTCLPVASWDHLTTKGLIHELPDVITVWNETQRREAVELHGVPAEKVVVTGAVAYDHWFDWEPSRSPAEFAEQVGLDPDRPFILYLGSSGFIAPDEGGFVSRWIPGLRRVAGGALDEVQFLVRPHPQNRFGPEHLRALAEIEGVAVYPRAGANPTDVEKRNDYYDSLHHCAAAVGINTSGMIEAAIVGAPVHTLLAPEYWATQMGSLHFRYLLPENGGMLKVAGTLEQQAGQLRESLAAGDRAAAMNDRLVEHFIRPYGKDVLAAPRLADVVEELAGRGRTDVAAPDVSPARGATGRAVAAVARSYMLYGLVRRRGLAGASKRVDRGRRDLSHARDRAIGSPGARRAWALARRTRFAAEAMLGRGEGARYLSRADKEARVRAKEKRVRSKETRSARRLEELGGDVSSGHEPERDDVVVQIKRDGASSSEVA